MLVSELNLKEKKTKHHFQITYRCCELKSHTHEILTSISFIIITFVDLNLQEKHVC